MKPNPDILYCSILCWNRTHHKIYVGHLLMSYIQGVAPCLTSSVNLLGEEFRRLQRRHHAVFGTLYNDNVKPSLAHFSTHRLLFYTGSYLYTYNLCKVNVWYEVQEKALFHRLFSFLCRCYAFRSSFSLRPPDISNLFA